MSISSDNEVREDKEIAEMRERYASRTGFDRYAYFNADGCMNNQERERQIIKMFVKHGFSNPEDIKLLDVGSGHGKNFLNFLKFGFSPANMTGIELFVDRCDFARSILPKDISLVTGDALKAEIADESMDVVCQFVVFSSILDDAFQEELARKMWQWLKPGGVILWFDFVYNNPSNKDVRRVSKSRVKELFPDGKFSFKSVILAPPISRRVSKISPKFYTLFNYLPFLRSHVLGFIQK